MKSDSNSISYLVAKSNTKTLVTLVYHSTKSRHVWPDTLEGSTTLITSLQEDLIVTGIFGSGIQPLLWRVSWEAPLSEMINYPSSQWNMGRILSLREIVEVHVR
jgi:hypothetical protein